MVTISHKVKLQNWLKFATLPLATIGSHVSNWLKLGLPRHLGSSACHFFRSPEKNCLSSHFHFQPGGQEVWSISISRQKKMSVWSRCRAEVDKAGKDKVPLMLQTADRHLLVLTTFHIKTSWHPTQAKSRRSICDSAKLRSLLWNLLGPSVNLWSGSTYHQRFKSTPPIDQSRAVFYLADKLIKFQNANISAGQLPWELVKYQIFLVDRKKLTTELWVKSWHFSSPNINFSDKTWSYRA